MEVKILIKRKRQQAVGLYFQINFALKSCFKRMKRSIKMNLFSDTDANLFIQIFGNFKRWRWGWIIFWFTLKSALYRFSIKDVAPSRSILAIDFQLNVTSSWKDSFLSLFSSFSAKWASSKRSDSVLSIFNMGRFEQSYIIEKSWTIWIS